MKKMEDGRRVRVIERGLTEPDWIVDWLPSINNPDSEYVEMGSPNGSVINGSLSTYSGNSASQNNNNSLPSRSSLEEFSDADRHAASEVSAHVTGTDVVAEKSSNGKAVRSSSNEDEELIEGNMCASTTGVVRVQSRKKAEMFFVRTYGFSCTREKVTESSLTFTHPSTQQQMLMWKSSPKTVLLLKKLGQELMEQAKEFVDAVVWHDGEVWRVALDTQSLEDDPESGKLADFAPLTNYKIERKYGVFSKLDACTFVTNVYNDGYILSIVTDASPHGTHVAGITSTFYPMDTMARKPADPEEELRWMAQEVRGYVEAVLNSLAANVPKAVVLCQVEKAKEDMLNKLYNSLSSQSTPRIEELL